MLHVTYEAIDSLEPGRLARIEETRGRVRVLLDRREPLADVVCQLNVEVDDLMSLARWFQLWDDEIVSRATPGSPLRAVYLLHARQPNGAVVREDKGLITVYVDPSLSVDHFAAAMNMASREVLAGGHWFQLYAGEIVDSGPERAVAA